MDRCIPGPWFMKKNGSLVRFRVVCRTVVTNIQLEMRQACAPLTMWAYVMPSKGYQPADEINALTLPFALMGNISCEDSRGEIHTVTCFQQRWEIPAGSKVSLLITAANTPKQEVCRILVGAIAATDHLSSALQRSLPCSQADLSTVRGDKAANLDPVVRIHLVGLSVGPPFLNEEPEWRPLLVRRWLELKGYMHEATIVKQPTATWGPFVIQEKRSFTMSKGDVKEAVAIKADGSCVKWRDGSVSLMDELQFFHRTYKPARPDKVVRVRRHPHRFSDVIGEIPFGLEVYSLGRETDRFTGEQYALIYLPEDPFYFRYIEMYGLVSCGERWVWGWSKLAGASGLLFLVEVESFSGTTGACMMPSEQIKYSPFPTAILFTCARHNKGVRIRKKPSLKSEKIGHLEPNEVKQAIALVQIQKEQGESSLFVDNPPAQPNNDTKGSGWLEFVEWKDGGFSLVHNTQDRFLTQVELTTGAKAFGVMSTHFKLPDSVEMHKTDEGVTTVIPKSGQKRSRNDQVLSSSRVIGEGVPCQSNATADSDTV